mmetsp:Transcript_58501/g.131819  ORF Transcript_58501/g.131819 Transcript_58501/m.131819 type:complete len:229 (+) Transcript_58501:94-780(+)
MVAQDSPHGAEESSEPQTYYDLIGVPEDVSPDDLTKAFRLRALEEHPDKGGDSDRFDELTKAYRTLEDAKLRDAYDEKLSKERERAQLVQDTHGHRAPTASDKQASAPMRAKTEPTWGSKRQGKMRNMQPGKPEHCAHEWKGMGSGRHYLLMIEDGATDEMKTEKLLDKYTSLPHNKEKRRAWLNGVHGKDKQDLLSAAKRREEAQKAKWDKWLNNGPRVSKGPKAAA